MSWNIVLDSSCDLMPSKHSLKNAELKIAPLTIRVGDVEFVDDDDIDVPKLHEDMEKEKFRLLGDKKVLQELLEERN